MTASNDSIKFAYWVPNVSGGLVISKIEQRTSWDITYNRRLAQIAEDNGFDCALSQIRFTADAEGPRAKMGAEPWAVSDAPPDFIKSQLRGIVGLRLPITRLDAKRKMSQNRNAQDRAGVVEGLSESTRPSDRIVAELIPK